MLVEHADRRPGERCCVAPPEGALEEEGALALTDDLELLAHPVRLRLLSVLARNPEPVCVCDLQTLVPVKQPTVSHHLKILARAGLVGSERRGLWTYYFAQASSVATLRGRIAAGLGSLVPPDANSADLKERVRTRYARAARDAQQGVAASCGCGSPTGAGCGSPDTATAENPITRDLYGADQTEGLPHEAVVASLGCGNPTALASITPGETILDLGSGGGIDVLLSARRTGPTGMVYGLDMTDEMLELARENQRKAGVGNAEFLKGDIEEIPLPAESVDLVISNCVINLAADKARVLREVFRVLRPGGRVAVSDIVVRGEVPPRIRQSMELWMGCLAGALEEGEYRRLLAEAGFEGIEVEPSRVYGREDVRELLLSEGIEEPDFPEAVGGRFMSAMVRARKPG